MTNRGDRPIQVGSHYHFYETNPALEFDRSATQGFRLNIPSGNAVRFEPGERKTVELVAFGGNQLLQGFRNAGNGQVKTTPQAAAQTPLTIPRAQYLATYGPPLTTKSALATPTSLPLLNKTCSHTVTNANLAAANQCAMVWHNLLVPAAAMKTCLISSSPMWRLSIIPASSKPTSAFATAKLPASARLTMNGVTPNMIIGAATEVHNGAHLIVIAGGIDTHIHLHLPTANRTCD